MAVTEIGDPRLQALFGAIDPREAGVRPVVALPRRGLSGIALASIAIVLAGFLFIILNERRSSRAEPAVTTGRDLNSSDWPAPPPLYVPPQLPALEAGPADSEEEVSRPRPARSPAPTPVRAGPSRVFYAPAPILQAPPAPISAPRPIGSGAPLVIDADHFRGASGDTASLVPEPERLQRMRASALANRSATVVQGTVIQAVLETGFNSSQPGFARAVVSRDVRSFDGSRVLIPRGSKLVGEFTSDIAQVQKRAMIVWMRLIRPDGMTINLDSPAVDRVGGNGVPASVNTHFWARFGDALLQSTVGIGNALAQRSLTGSVVIVPGAAAPVAAPAAGRVAPSNNYVPTLTIPAGKSISVFVAHDLDFSAASSSQ